jgi:hypothetical protein
LQAVQSFWQRPIAKVDNRTPQDLARSIDAQSRATVSIEEAQAELAFMCIDTTFADAGDPLLSHERGHVTWKHIQEFAQKGGIDQDRLIVDFDLHDNALWKDRHGFEVARWRSPRLIGSEVRPKSSPFFCHLKKVSKMHLMNFLGGRQCLAAFLRYTLADLMLILRDLARSAVVARQSQFFDQPADAHSPSANFSLA